MCQRSRLWLRKKNSYMEWMTKTTVQDYKPSLKSVSRQDLGVPRKGVLETSSVTDGSQVLMWAGTAQCPDRPSRSMGLCLQAQWREYLVISRRMRGFRALTAWNSSGWFPHKESKSCRELDWKQVCADLRLGSR